MNNKQETSSPPALLPARVDILFAVGMFLVLLGALFHVSALDAPWLVWIHAEPHGAVAEVAWSCLTILGLGWTALILVMAADRGRGDLIALLVVIFVIGSILTHVPKYALHSPRPASTEVLPHLHVIGYAFRGPVSMPSGHALTATATVTVLWLVFGRARPWLSGILFAAVAGFVGWSRLAAGAHWPSDVVVGTGLGLLACWSGLRLVAWAPVNRVYQRFARAVATQVGQRWIAVLEFGAAAGIVHERTGYPLGIPMVFLLAAVAAVSAGWRLYASREPAPAAARAPAKTT